MALLFGATTINYVDRQVLGILAPTLTRELGWRETDYAAIVSWFSVAYGVGLLVMGGIMDRIGVRTGLAIAVLVWSLASMGHALVRTVAGFCALGIIWGAWGAVLPAVQLYQTEAPVDMPACVGSPPCPRRCSESRGSEPGASCRRGCLPWPRTLACRLRASACGIRNGDGARVHAAATSA